MTRNDKRRLFVSPDSDLQDVARCEQPGYPWSRFRWIYRFRELACNVSTLSELLRGIRRVQWMELERSRSDRAV